MKTACFVCLCLFLAAPILGRSNSDSFINPAPRGLAVAPQPGPKERAMARAVYGGLPRFFEANRESNQRSKIMYSALGIQRGTPAPMGSHVSPQTAQTGSRSRADTQTGGVLRSGGRRPMTTGVRTDASGGGRAAIRPRPSAKLNGSQIKIDESVQFNPTTLKASFGSVGLYNLVGLGTWNGKPVSPTNMPDDAQRLLASTINFYIPPGANNVMYVQVTDVLTTTGAYWFGTAFDDVTQTGVHITFPDPAILSLGVSYSGVDANPGEVLADGTSGTEVDTPLSSTPGFTMDPPLNSTLLLHTLSGAANGFTSLYGIYGTTRIRGGGVFQLTFDPTVDLTQLDFGKLLVESEYGLANQYISAANPVPLVNQPLVPTSVAPEGSQFSLTVNGTGFVPASVVNWNGSARATTFLSSLQLQAVIPSADIAEEGTAWVTVRNPSPGGGDSNVEFVQITKPDASLAFKKSNLTAGSAPVRLVTADFNGDGIMDIATANELDNTVSVLLGTGEGTFHPVVTYPAGGQPGSTAVGDFNGDGKLDLAVANNCPGYPTCSGATLSVLLGNGDGTFQPQVEYQTAKGPDSIAVGDFNHDGKLDLAIVSLQDSAVCIFLGNGEGTFQPCVEYPAGSIPPNGIAIGDFNSDGSLDLALTTCCTDPGLVAILLGNGDGSFKPPAFFETAVGYLNTIQTGDLNGDGKLDLVATGIGAGSESGGLSVLLGNGDGTFQTHVDYLLNTAVDSVAVGDFNGDGIPDLAATHINPAGQVSILAGNGDGTFGAASNFPTGFDPSDISAADFNRDGRLDLVTGNRDSTISVLLQSPVVALSPPALSFGNQNVGTSSLPQNVTLTNTGSAILKMSSISITGQNANDFSQQNNCGSSLSVGATCTITVTFVPTLAGSRRASVSISDNASGGLQTVILSGTGTIVMTNTTIASSLNPSAFGQSVIFTATVTSRGSGTPTGTVSFFDTATGTNLGSSSLNGSGVATLQTSTLGSSTHSIVATYSGDTNFSSSVSPTLSQVVLGAGAKFSPTSLVFANQTVATSSSSESITLKNTGDIPLTFNSITFTGTDPANFHQTNNCGSSLAGGATCTFSVTFKPTAAGTRSAALTLSDNAPSKLQKVPVSGVGVLPAVTLSRTGLTFSRQVVFTTSKPQTVTLTNTGLGILNISKIAATGAFSQTNNCGSPLNPGASCTISVAFSPNTIGTLTGSIAITDNAPSKIQKVALTGIGTSVQLAPLSVKFGNQPVGTTSLAKTITLSNKGHATVSITGITIVGLNAGDFSETNTCGTSVASGASCFIKVNKPNVTGARAAAVSISDNGGGSPQKIALTGSGT